MANLRFIRAALEAVTAVLKADTPGILQGMQRDPFAYFGRAFVGIVPAPPSVWVMPRTTAIAPEGWSPKQQDLVTVKIGVVGGEPELVVDAALDYVLAVTLAVWDRAVEQTDNTILRVHVQSQDYGPLYESGKSFARFPEVHLVIDRQEVL